MVPVLSVQITVAEPSVSTAGIFLTIAFFLAIFCTPKASVIASTVGSPSGITATARVTATTNMAAAGSPRHMPIMKNSIAAAIPAYPSSRESPSMLFSSGVSCSSPSAT